MLLETPSLQLRVAPTLFPPTPDLLSAPAPPPAGAVTIVLTIDLPEYRRGPTSTYNDGLRTRGRSSTCPGHCHVICPINGVLMYDQHCTLQQTHFSRC